MNRQSALDVILQVTQQMQEAAFAEDWSQVELLAKRQDQLLADYFRGDHLRGDVVQIEKDLRVLKYIHDDTTRFITECRQRTLDEAQSTNRGRRAMQAYAAADAH